MTTEYYSPSDERDQQIQTDSDDGEDDSSVTSVVESPAVTGVQPSEDEGTVYEREKARIETITRLEQRLRELEAENEQLRKERDAERSRRRKLKNDVSDSATSSGLLGRLKRVFHSN